LGRIAEILEMRRAAAQRYHSLLSGIQGLELPPLALPRRTISWFVYVVHLTSEAARDGCRLTSRKRELPPGATLPPFICSLHGGSAQKVVNSG